MYGGFVLLYPLIDILNHSNQPGSTRYYRSNEEPPEQFVERMVGERQWGPARIVLRSLVVSKPENIRINYQLGLAEIWCRNAEIGLEYLGEAKRLGLESPELHVAAGEGLMFLGQYQRALSNFQFALSLNPEVIDPYLKSALALEAMGEFNTAIDFLEAAITLEPANKSAQILMESMLMKKYQPTSIN